MEECSLNSKSSEALQAHLQQSAGFRPNPTFCKTGFLSFRILPNALAAPIGRPQMLDRGSVGTRISKASSYRPMVRSVNASYINHNDIDIAIIHNIGMTTCKSALQDKQEELEIVDGEHYQQRIQERREMQ
ncbi:hypothetical protein PAAG_11188 [Paracoccidioides lutzii Pb01]|uniref:Uncharacterized protein n=1 Tax=Paracoccidioides lutzii (strain ATCC MYA-826 / Pb01) TaxID=502779 RepID=A0A0A2V3E3_PARBA|nr:hypothetical protein PAAG_11188 [Paracoccidioides lutzii Pb01]KGQ02013.1 hypothetical protein PAAG_11188 [Paracoccidioides lutzii Pb01]